MPRNINLKKIKKENFTPEHLDERDLEHKRKKKASFRRKKINNNHFYKNVKHLIESLGLNRFVNFLHRKKQEFIRIAYKEDKHKVKNVNIRNTNYLHRVVFFVKHAFKVIFMTIYGVFKVAMPVILPFSAVVGIFVFGFFISKYSLALQIIVDNNPLDAYVENENDLAKIRGEVSKQIMEKNNGEYLVEQFPSYQLVLVEKSKISEESAVFNQLYKMADDVAGKSFGVYLGDVFLGALSRQEDAEALEKYLLNAYISEPDIEDWEIVKGLRYEKGSYDAASETSYADMLKLFTKPVNSIKYTVESGDSPSLIAKKHSIGIPDLKLMNELVDFEKLFVGQTIEVGSPANRINVKTTKLLQDRKVSPYAVVQEKSDTFNGKDLFEGIKKTKQEGVSGLTITTRRVVYINGVAQTPDPANKKEGVISEEIVRNVQNEIVVTGTKKIAPTKSGNFNWPIRMGENNSYISSPFGSRYIFGSTSFHRGLDIAANAGTPIYAAASGTVVAYGWDTYGLGNCVRIDVGNGIVTSYGHCSRLAPDISVGSKVPEGYLIAYVGKTGNATGNHVHFAVNIRDTQTFLDPMDYLK